MNLEKRIILKVLVGSRGYGIYDKGSDFDYRAVYILPTSKILSLGFRYKGTHWVEDQKAGKDETAYEIGHFLNLATQCNPTILNTLKAPVQKAIPEGLGLRELFPHLLDSKRCYDAFKGYGLNQRKKMLNNKDLRWTKYGCAYVRQLWYLKNLFFTGDYDFIVKGIEIENVLIQIRSGKWSPGQIIDFTSNLLSQIDSRIESEGWPSFPTDPDLINEFLLRIRKKYWSF